MEDFLRELQNVRPARCAWQAHLRAMLQSNRRFSKMRPREGNTKKERRPETWLRNDPAHHSFEAMKSRCLNPKHVAYARYGGRGITICERWGDYDNFLEDMGARPSGTTLDRIDNDLGYYKENCRWATRVEQQQNRRGNREITFRGETKMLSEWCRITGVTRNTANYRLDKGYDLDFVFNKDLTFKSGNTVRNTRVTAFGETKTVRRWAEDSRCKISEHGLHSRLTRGMHPEVAITSGPQPGRWSKFDGEKSLFPSSVEFAKAKVAEKESVVNREMPLFEAQP